MKLEMGCFTAFISIFYLAGFWVLWHGVSAAIQSTKAASWPTTPATIKDIKVHETKDDGSTFEVKVQYGYSVDGVEYEGSRLAFGYYATSDRETHDEICRRIKDAASVEVRYDPSDPSISCLSHGLHRSIWLTLVFAIMWFSFIIGFTLIWWMFTWSDTVLLENLAVK